MPTAGHILVPTDGSQHSLKAAMLAGDLARGMQARVSVLHVQDERAVVPQAWNAAPESAANDNQYCSVKETRQAMEQKASTTEIAHTRMALGDVPEGLEQVQVWGFPVDEICRYAAEQNVDLIVMGSRGGSKLMRVIRESISDDVANTAPCAVTIVR